MTKQDHDREVGIAVRELAEARKTEASLKRRLSRCVEQLTGIIEGDYDSQGRITPDPDATPIEDANELLHVQGKIKETERFLHQQGLGSVTVLERSA